MKGLCLQYREQYSSSRLNSLQLSYLKVTDCVIKLLVNQTFFYLCIFKSLDRGKNLFKQILQ